VSEDLKVYDVLFGEYAAQIQLSDEDAARLGLTVEADEPSPPPARGSRD
jgi:hypothetical protein